MATTAQKLANRNNSRKSTGPKTAEGKAVVSQNAVKHGLFAAEAVITGENPADYELYHDQFLAELLPVGMLESMLAERIVSLSWRLQRAERMQNQSLEYMIERHVTDPSAVQSRKNHIYSEGFRAGDPRFDSDHLALGRIAVRDWSNCKVFDRMILYERRIENSLYKTINRLKQYQVVRRIELAETRKPSPSLRDEAAARRSPAENLDDLKKQSQFAAAQLAANSCIQGDYENNPAGGNEENKANSKPNKANRRASAGNPQLEFGNPTTPAA